MLNIITGRFTSTGTNQFVYLPSGFTRFEMNNVSIETTPVDGSIAQAYFEPWMANGTGIGYKTVAADGNAIAPLAFTTNGFYFYDNTSQAYQFGTAYASTISTATPPLVTTSNTSGLQNGSIVRFYTSTGASQINAIDFTIGSVTTNTSFTLPYMTALPAAVTAGTYRQVNYLPYLYPSKRVISNMVANSNNPLWTDVTMTVTGDFVVGQKVRLTVDPVNFGVSFVLPQYSTNWPYQTEATVMAVNITSSVNTITVDAQITGTFAWPNNPTYAFTPCFVVPAGINAGITYQNNIDPDSSAFRNLGMQGLTLVGGAGNPAGASGNIITWRAYTANYAIPYF